MNIEETSADDYQRICNSQALFYQSSRFNQLNREKCDNLLFLIIRKGKKAKLAISGGIIDGLFCSPFSAPFGGPVNLSGKARLEYITSFPLVLSDYLKSRGIKKIAITLAPMFYDQAFLSELTTSFYLGGYELKRFDLNHYFDLSFSTYMDKIEHSAKKNLNIALKHDFTFIRCSSDEEKKNAYNVIRRNREEKKYELKISYEEMKAIIDTVNHDFFLVKDNQGNNLAASINFQVHPDISQVIYWGSLSKYDKTKVMNYLAFNIHEFFRERGLKYVDIGPSMINGGPNYGLSAFKKSIGCTVCNKVSFCKEL